MPSSLPRAGTAWARISGRHRRGVAGACLLALAAACGDDQAPIDEPTSPLVTFPTSLHATGRGKVTHYSSANGGFEDFTGIAYYDLACQSCHQPDCLNCHTDSRGEDSFVAETTCHTCHGRQNMEVSQGFSDVHREANMTCMDCHTQREMHGDGVEYASMLADGAMDAACEGCHATLSSNTAHDIHVESVDCSACHAQSVVTCYNCHFESEVLNGEKRPYGVFKNWTFLVNRDGKVHPANFQSVKYQDKSFLVFAPYYAHTISREALDCVSCHVSTALQQYEQEGRIDVVTWNEVENRLEHIEGVIPIPPDYTTAMTFDFVDFVDGEWVFMESGPERFQMLFGEPLTAEQIRKLLWQ